MKVDGPQRRVLGPKVPLYEGLEKLQCQRAYEIDVANVRSIKITLMRAVGKSQNVETTEDHFTESGHSRVTERHWEVFQAYSDFP